MIWQAAVVFAGFAGPALIALGVYLYRSVIAYEFVSLSQQFFIVEGQISLVDEAPPFTFATRTNINLERLTVQNVGLKNLKSITLHLEHTQPLFDRTVKSTKSIGKGTVHFANEGDDLLIRIDELPRHEQVVLEFSNLGVYLGEMRDLKGSSGSYRVVRRMHFEVARQIVLWSVLINAAFFILAVSVRFAMSR
jgi:hypothetical protein